MSAPASTQHIRHLEQTAANLVTMLGGVWSPRGGMCRCPAHDDRAPSLSVRVGHSAILFKCFAGCDATDVIRAIARIDRRALEVDRSGDRSSHISDNMAWFRGRALDLWDAAQPLAGTAAEIYLQRRSLRVASPALRFHPHTPLGRGKCAIFRPALIAALHDGDDVVAVQRTFLDPEHPRRARDLANPRRMLGRPGRAAVVLAAATDVLGLAEGVETALSAMILLGIPVWAVLGNERLARVAVPAAVDRIVLLADNDRPGRRAAGIAREVHAAPGRTIATIWPWRGLNDWNDVLRMEGKGGGK